MTTSKTANKAAHKAAKATSNAPRKASAAAAVNTHANIQAAGLKATQQRARILELFRAGSARHWSAEEVYRAMKDAGEDVGLATVYRALAQFERAGLLERHVFDSGRAVFELGGGAHHDHLVCLDCGTVIEFVDAAIERRQQQIATEEQFEIHAHALQIYGHCTRRSCTRRLAA